MTITTALVNRLHHATVKAQEAFWAAIADEFPEVKSGDFSPAATDAFDSACMSAGSSWVAGNWPETPPTTTQIVYRN